MPIDGFRPRTESPIEARIRLRRSPEQNSTNPDVPQQRALVRQALAAATVGGALIALTLAVSSLTRANLTSNEDAALEARASDTIALINAATNQMSATWASARLVVLAAHDDQRELARLITPSFSKSLFANLSIVHVAGGRGRVEFTVGSRRPRLLAGFDAATWEQIAAVRGDQPQLIRIAPAAGSKVVGHAVAIDARPHEYVYTEFYTGDIIREAFPNAAQLSGAAYAGPRESPALLLAANAPSLPITGRRVVKHITILGGPATLVIGSRNPIVAGISARAPEIILAIGLLLALSIASSLFVLLRRRDAAVRRAATLGRLTDELGASEARFRELFEDASDIVFTLDTGGAVTALNRAGERAFGRDRSEIVGERLSSLLVAEDMTCSTRTSRESSRASAAALSSPWSSRRSRIGGSRSSWAPDRSSKAAASSASRAWPATSPSASPSSTSSLGRRSMTR